MSLCVPLSPSLSSLVIHSSFNSALHTLLSTLYSLLSTLHTLNTLLTLYTLHTHLTIIFKVQLGLIPSSSKKFQSSFPPAISTSSNTNFLILEVLFRILQRESRAPLHVKVEEVRSSVSSVSKYPSSTKYSHLPPPHSTPNKHNSFTSKFSLQKLKIKSFCNPDSEGIVIFNVFSLRRFDPIQFHKFEFELLIIPSKHPIRFNPVIRPVPL